MTNGKAIDQSERETSRWVSLDALYHGGGYDVAERLVLAVLEAVPLRATAADVRAHLSYLESLGLCRVTQLPDGRRMAAITSRGTDVVEYNAECPPGVARPKKYW